MRYFGPVFFLLALLFSACGNSKLVTENRKLKLKVTDLELRVYELTESPDHLAEQVLQDIDLLMTLPYVDNLELAKSLISSFKSNYPKNKRIDEFVSKEKEIDAILLKKPSGKHGEAARYTYSGFGNEMVNENVKVEFGVYVSKNKSGFINVELKIRNASAVALSNIWIRGGLINNDGEEYGITQDFFFNRLEPNQQKSETLSWEYVQLHKIDGITLKEMRYSKNRQTKMLQEKECYRGQSNVKIFLEF